MRRAGTFLLLTVIVLLLLPLLSLGWTTLSRLRPPQPRLLVLDDGRRILAAELDRDLEDRREGTRRVLQADGSVGFLGSATVSAMTVPEAWFVRRDDGPPVMGRLDGLATGAGDTLRGEAAETALREMPERIREDKTRMAREVRSAAPGAAFGRAMRQWELLRVADDRALAFLEDLDGVRRPVRLSAIRESWKASSSALGPWLAAPIRAWTLFLEDPDPWSGGGLFPVVSATLATVFLSGLLGGIPAILAALRISERTSPGRGARWIRRGSAWFAAVPGVVWGTIGAGVLVGGAGDRLDRLFGDHAWRNGGVLWGAVTLGALSAPTTLSAALRAIDRTPRLAREIARSCGATRWQVLRLVVLPQASRGLAGAWVSGLARAAGETAPLLMVGAARSVGGMSTESVHWFPRLSGGFLHLGVLACDPPWPALEAELGHPLAFLSLSLLAALCVALELVATRLLRQGPRRSA